MTIIDRTRVSVDLAIKFLEAKPEARLLIVTTMPYSFVKELVRQFVARIEENQHLASWTVAVTDYMVRTRQGGFVKIRTLDDGGRDYQKLLGLEIDQVFYEEARLHKIPKLFVETLVRPKRR